MSSEPASGTPIADSKTTETPAPPNTAATKSEVEYDDFGLPIRIRRPRTPLEDSSDDEHVTDAEGAQSASREQAVPLEKNTAEAEKVVEETPIVNGHSDGKKEELLEHKEEGKKLLLEEKKTDGTLGSGTTATHTRQVSSGAYGPISEYSHQQLSQPTQKDKVKTEDDIGGWQTMPAYARYDMYDDDNRLVARENLEELEDMSGYGNLGGAAKGYTRVVMDDDVDSQTSMDENTAYLFKEKGNALLDDDDDEAARDPLAQMQTTKNILTEGQRIAYVGLARLALIEMENRLSGIEVSRGNKKLLELTNETTKMWAQKTMVRLYTHMDVDSSEQIMIEQLSEHGVIPADLTPALMQNARVKNPAAIEETESSKASITSPRPESVAEDPSRISPTLENEDDSESPPPPPYQEHEGDDLPAVRTPSQLPDTKSLDIDVRWTILCDLFLVLIADSAYDARSRQLLEEVGKYLSVDWLEICRFEKRVTDALEMQEEANKENWNEEEHIKSRRKRARNKRIALMGLATVGGSLVIGLSAGLLAPVIGAGLAAGFTTIGVAGTTGFLAGAGGAAIITTTGVVTGGTIAVRATNRRTGTVSTFEYRPLHNNKRVNLIVTVAGWMNGKVDDVRLPFSTVDPVMGDIYSVLWEPEMLRSMGDTINILATEALTQGLQQVLGSTILTALMSAMVLPMALTKLSYLIDNPWVVSQARADMAGRILADSLIDRNLGTRPITLVGFSLGARVIFSCLKELAVRGAFGLVQNVYMFGTPVVAKKDDYIRARAIVPGRFVNGYATNDWILGYLFRATSGGVLRVAGLNTVEVPGVENVNVTALVPGHMAYRASMPKILREVGWIVESDEFTEIEDPDPENHEQRQRELINEIEEARKELEKKPEKKGFAFWRKKKAAKKDWEVYDEHSQKPIDRDADPATIAENSVMFDIDAIHKEVAALSAERQLAAEGVEVREIQTTLPPMKIDIAATSPNPYSTLRQSKSFNDSLGATPATHSSTATPPSQSNGILSTHSNEGPTKGYDEYDEHIDGEIEMTFDTSFKASPSTPPSKPAAPPLEPPDTTSWDTPAERPPLKSHPTEPNISLAPSYNAWTDELEDEFGKEKELQMTFE